MVRLTAGLRTWAAWQTMCLVLMLPAVGCGGGSYMPTNPALARESLQAALDHWKGGGKPTDLAQRSPPIVMGDEDWEGGKRLVRFALLEGERDDGANLHIAVRLVLADEVSGEREVVVTYIVGTSPVVSIFRE